MRPHLDGIIFSLQQHGGISVYFKELLSRFTMADQATLTVETPMQHEVSATSLPNVRFVERRQRLLERIRTCRSPAPEKGETPTVFHSSYYRLPSSRTLPTVVTVHDLVAFRFPDIRNGRMRRWLMTRAIERAQHIICISESTHQDLLEFFRMRADQRVSVIYNGVSDQFAPLNQTATGSPKDSRPFALFVGQRGGYKNFCLALKALEHLPELNLHCVGGGPLKPEELAEVSESTRARVRHLGFVTDEALNVLYNQAHCLLYPSAYEGFGIPVVEAMRAGCPVVSIDCKAVLEVGGPALSVSEMPTDARSLAQSIMRLDDPEVRATVRRLGLVRSEKFSWDQCFQQTVTAYRCL